jgi:hypothetical protein
MKRIAFKHTEYPAKLQEYKFFNIGTKTYLVHEGCGPVLEFRNDSIVRIDNSFLHRNQFGSARFVFNNEIYFYGGYGLFTYKNILTKYDFQTREWTEVKTYSDVPLETRKNALSYLINNDLYVFGGYTNDETKIQWGKPLDNTIWQLHLPSMKWICKGEVNLIQILNYGDYRLFNNNQENIFLISNEFNIINPRKNIMEKHEIKLYLNFISNYFEEDSIICVLKNNINQSKYFAILSINQIKGKRLSTSVFIKSLPLSINNSIILIITIIIILITLLILRKKIMNKLKPFNGIIYNQQSNQFLYKNKPVTIFDEQEIRLLHYLMEHNNQFVSLNNLNQLFENNNQPETISATVKRREQAVSRLLTKVSKITGIDEEVLILEKKNSEDKRIKDLKILPNLLKML